MPDYYCTSESDSIDSDRRRLGWEVDSLDSKVMYLNSLMSQVNLAQSFTYSSVSYYNSLVDMYNLQLSFYKSSASGYNYNLDRFNRRVRNYNSDCVGP